MKSILAILLFLGIIAGPGYYIYCSSFSGSSVDRFTVFSQDVSSLRVGNMTMQSSGSNAKWESPVTLKLVPEMNPLSVTAIIHYMKPASGGMKRTEYRAEFTKDKRKIWEESFSVSAKKEKKEGDSVKIGSVMLSKVSTPIKSFSLEESGMYQLNFQQAGVQDVAVAQLEVDIRRNVIIPNMTIVLSGGSALLLAVVGLILINKRSHPPSDVRQPGIE